MAKSFDFDREARAVYAQPLDEFVTARDAAAKRAKDAGEAEAARELKALRKPNLPAWAVNRAFAADPKAGAGLIKAGERLEAAQRKAVEGKGADPLRKAMSGYAEAVERLMGPVEDELAGAGGAAAVDRARETLRAVASDEHLRDELRAGTLARDREAAGLGGGGTPAPTRSRSKAGRAKAKPAKERRRDGRERGRPQARRAGAEARGARRRRGGEPGQGGRPAPRARPPGPGHGRGRTGGRGERARGPRGGAGRRSQGATRLSDQPILSV